MASKSALLSAALTAIALASAVAPRAEAVQTRVPFRADTLHEWTSVRSTGGEDPHAYGITLQLWKHEGELYGYMSEYSGQPFDPWGARLDSIKFDEATRTLSFKARLATGVTHDPRANQWVPADMLYRFSGVVVDSGIAGVLEKTSLRGNNPGRLPDEPTALAISDESRSSGMPAESFAQWIEMQESVLRFRSGRFDKVVSNPPVKLELSVASPTPATATIPALQLRIQNVGADTVSFSSYWMATDNTQFWVDGVWYYPGPRAGGSNSESRLAPGALSEQLTLVLRDGLYELDALPALSRVLQLLPGKHTIRVRTSLTSNSNDEFISNPITIDIPPR